MLLKDHLLLRRLMDECGLTPTDLAARSRKTDGQPPSRQLVSRLVNGRDRRASRAVAESISEAVGVRVGVLWEDNETRTTRPERSHGEQPDT